MENKTVVVIGAVNMDICGKPNNSPIMRDSNPGTVSFSPGGVGRNIAHNLVLLGVNVKFVAAIGTDANGESIMQSCLDLGFDMHLCRRIEGGRTSSYLYITDEKGEMQLGVSDTDIAGSIDPEYLSGCIDEINAADAVVADANLTAETLRWIGEHVTVPIYADPVSTAKAKRLMPLLPKLYAFKPNAIEAMSMTGKPDAQSAAAALTERGVKRVFVSLGGDGMLAVEGKSVAKLPCLTTNIVNTTGCGDAATAAIVWAGVNGGSAADCAAAAMRASAITIRRSEAVSPELCAESVINFA